MSASYSWDRRDFDPRSAIEGLARFTEAAHDAAQKAALRAARRAEHEARRHDVTERPGHRESHHREGHDHRESHREGHDSRDHRERHQREHSDPRMHRDERSHRHRYQHQEFGPPWGELSKVFADAFGPRGPFGPGGGRGGRGGRRRNRMGRGDVRSAVLILLDEQPMNGYQLIKEITERSNGAWRPSPGSIYPALQLLEDEGLVASDVGEGRRTVALTDKGREYVEENRAKLERVWDTASENIDETAQQAMSDFPQLAFAAMQVFRAGNPAQVAEARQVLAEARRKLYLILADEQFETTDEEPEESEE